MVYQLTTNRDTWLKATPEQSATIRKRNLPNTLLAIAAGTVLQCHDVVFWEGKHVSADIDGDDHYYLQLVEPLADSPAIRWFAFAQHTDLDEGDHPDPHDTPVIIAEDRKVAAAKAIVRLSAQSTQDAKSEAAKQDLGPLVSIPGFSGQKRLLEPIYWQGTTPSRFTWAEATKNGQRIPINASVTQRVIQGAKRMDRFRSMAGGPLFVTSWYRDPITNRRVGGASRSQHLQGWAVDFYGPSDLVAFFHTMKRDAVGSNGGLAIGRGFIHTDAGPRRRWHYPGGPKVNLW
ncbi:MAG: D-Ala-D-Ala carboxypeptidase family metallohydrolase [Cyanobacteria bacterium J06626_23]